MVADKEEKGWEQLATVMNFYALSIFPYKKQQALQQGS